MLEIFTVFADAITYKLMGLSEQSQIGSSVHFFIEDTTKIFFLLAFLMVTIGYFRTYISSEKIRLWLDGKPRLFAYILAAILGAITPFCSCSSIPLFIAFLSSGIPLGVTMAFLITSPMINEVAAIMFGEILGWQFTLAYVAVGMGTGMIGGFIIDSLKLEKWVEPFVYETRQTAHADNPDKEINFRQRMRKSWDDAADIIKRVWHYVFLGVGVGAAIHGFVPQQWFIDNASIDNVFAVPVAVLMAIPLYSNVTGVIPIAEVLIAKGLPIGTTLAFIMSTVAISLPELVILRKVLMPKMLVFFVVYLAVAFIIVGYGFNMFYMSR